ncbi:NUDIX hydrolase [Lactococcus lactis]|uniref:NUDIX hydrolase n=1 Tax=Lactococcus lactis TaxID=1358 RepID=UPI0018C57041|nr:NUDIX domain-containing protein [Lactococcus lactis]MBG1278047.1 NUDIX domain-containing protein [Lactococcus lactis subsp. lactis]
MIEKSSALILNEKDQLLVTKKKSNTSHYILPGGKLEEGETPEKALIRELREELDVNVVSYSYLATCVEKSQFEDFDLKMFMYLVKVDGIPKASREILSLDWINLDTKRKDLATGITLHALPLLRERGKDA